MNPVKITTKAQRQLAGYCRTGVKPDIAGTQPERLSHYRRLVYNGINDTLVQAYPITHQILSEDEWDNLVYDFFSNHDCQTPYIWKMPFEFYQYISEHELAIKRKRPYLTDLLYFEWIEIEVHTMADEHIPYYNEGGDLLDSALVINPEFRLIQLAYPVHSEVWYNFESKKGTYFILVYRDLESGNVNFFNLSPFLALVFSKIADENLTAREAISESGEMMEISDEHLLIQNSLPFLNDLFTLKIVLGYAAHQ